MKTIRRDVKKLTKPEDEKEKARRKWVRLQSRFNWNETYEEATEQLPQNRNADDAHPKITAPLLNEAVDVI